jgi:hypothetical protein
MLLSQTLLPISKYCAATLVAFSTFRFLLRAGLLVVGTVQRSCWGFIHVMAGRLLGDARRVVLLRVLEAERAFVHYFIILLVVGLVAVELDLTDGSFRSTVIIDHDGARLVGFVLVAVVTGNRVAWIPS